MLWGATARAGLGRCAIAAAGAAVVFSSVSVPGAQAHSAEVARRPRIMRLRTAASAPAIAPTAARASGLVPRLTYRGGRLVSHVKIDLVVWDQWDYMKAPLRGTRSVSTFLGGMVQSPYVDWLREYNTAKPAQTINRGSLEGIYRIAPNPNRNGATINDTGIQKELTVQINNGHLPAPSPDRIFVVFFPGGHRIVVDGDDSHTGFCAYHNAFSYGATPLYYAVIPKEANNPGCRADTVFNDLTSTVSHEVVESMTDPGAGVIDEGWYDDTFGEIADICRQYSGTLTFADGQSYVVQQEWSNATGRCVTVAPPPVPPVPPPACAAPTQADRLLPGQCLKVNQGIFSAQRSFQLALDPDGRVVLRGGLDAPWYTPTNGRAVSEVVMQSDGNLVLYGPAGPIWTSGTAGNPNSTLVVQEDGNVVIYGASGATWTTQTAGACGAPQAGRLLAGECLGWERSLTSPNKVYTLVVHSGNLQLFGTSGLLWQSGTDHTTQFFRFGANGNLTGEGYGSVNWQTKTAGRGGNQLVVQNDGNVVLWAPSGAIWSTGTAGRV